jgi:hypothetical protein
VGPSGDAIRKMGSKSESKNIMTKANVINNLDFPFSRSPWYLDIMEKTKTISSIDNYLIKKL